MAKEILIADSDKGDQEAFQGIFETTDHKLVFSENGEDALLRVKLFRPDLIIAGMTLREKSGLELCEAVKTDPELRHIPFILLTGMFEEITEKDRARRGVDGVISKPLQEKEVIGLVDRLFEEKMDGRIGGERTQQEKGWGVLSEMDSPRSGKEDFLLDQFDDENEEIIELVDVIEEPESRMSIDNFITPVKPEPIRDLAPLESWDKLFEEERKSIEKASGERPSEETFDLSIEEEKETGPQVDLRRERETSPEMELFEKIELEEILDRVEQLRPSIEKEWPTGAEIDKKIEDVLPRPELETTEKWMELRDFESALKAGVKTEETGQPLMEELQPFGMKGAEAEFMEVEHPAATPDTFRKEERTKLPESMEEELRSFAFGEPKEMEKTKPPQSIGERLQATVSEQPREQGRPTPAETIEDEIQSLMSQEPKREAPLDISLELAELPSLEVETPSAPETAQPVELAFEEETLSGLPEEEFPDAFIEELEEEEIRSFERPVERKAEEITLFHEEEPAALPQGLELPGFIQEVQPPVLSREAEAPKTLLEEVHPPTRAFDRKMEEAIGKGVQEMMEGFITKVLPEMTQNILNLTVERIEKMVKEIVPDLAERAIQEEIRRLQKGEKE